MQLNIFPHIYMYVYIFFISNKSFIKIKKEFRYTKSVHESSKNTKKNYGLQESKKSIVEECGTRFAAADHSLRELNDIFTLIFNGKVVRCVTCV